MKTPRDSETPIEARLRGDARSIRVSTPEGLEQRIAAAVRRDAADKRERGDLPVRRPGRWLFPTLAGLASATCVIAALLLWQEHTTRQHERMAEIEYLFETVQRLPTRLAEAELPVARRIASNDPLARELSSVREDARNALDFLAVNFLPSQAFARENGTPTTLPPQET